MLERGRGTRRGVRFDIVHGHDRPKSRGVEHANNALTGNGAHKKEAHQHPTKVKSGHCAGCRKALHEDGMSPILTSSRFYSSHHRLLLSLPSPASCPSHHFNHQCTPHVCRGSSEWILIASVLTDPHPLLSFPCAHTFHLPCLLSYNSSSSARPSSPSSPNLPSFLSYPPASERTYDYDRSTGPKVDRAALIKAQTVVGEGCPVAVHADDT